MKFTAKRLTMTGLTLGLIACGSPTSAEQKIQGDEHSLSIPIHSFLSQSGVDVDSAWISIQMPGKNLQTFGFALGSDSTVKLDKIPAGSNQSIHMHLYDSTGFLLWAGDTTIDLLGGKSTSLQLKLKQKFATIKTVVPLPLTGHGIVGGSLTLQKGTFFKQVPLSGPAGEKTFEMSSIPFGSGYDTKIRLWTQTGDTTYSMDTSLAFQEGLAQNLSLKLKSLFASLTLSLKLEGGAQTVLNLGFPDAARRSPTHFGEIIFSELMPYPTTGGDSLEWFELYNTTGDTLNLTGCVVKKTRTSTAASTSLALDTLGLSFIAPGAYAYFGREKTSSLYRYSSFVLSNSGQDVLLSCGSALLDSLNYVERKFPYAVQTSMGLQLAKFEHRLDSSSWCAGYKSYASGGLTMYGTPGYANACL